MFTSAIFEYVYINALMRVEGVVWDNRLLVVHPHFCHECEVLEGINVGVE